MILGQVRLPGLAASRIPEIEPRLFSFNNPYGACPACDGLGTKMLISTRPGRADTATSRSPRARSSPGRRTTVARTTRRRWQRSARHFKAEHAQALERAARAGAAR